MTSNLALHIFLPLDCGENPTEYTDKTECADGALVEVTKDADGVEYWNGCLDRGSTIFRCPVPYVPCQSRRKDQYGVDSRDFECALTCEHKGGKRQSCIGGKIFVCHKYTFT